MKKSFSILACLVLFCFLSSFVITRNDISNTFLNQSVALEKDCMGEPEAYVSEIDRSHISDGEIIVKVKVRNYKESTWYGIKVTPISQISGLVVEGSLFVSVCYGNCNSYFKNDEGEVTFHCYAGKEGDAQFCRAYDFQARIVD